MSLTRPFISAFALTAETTCSVAPDSLGGSSAPTVGRSILGVKVDVAAVEAKGFRASRLIGAAVFNEHSTEIGTVNDLIVSGDGRVNLAIVDVGGFLGIDAKHVVIPSHLFQVGADEKVLLPGATENELKAMPAFHFDN
ncbi:MAG: PRC-barrel domain-containing protein [Filomicrobium sp.]